MTDMTEKWHPHDLVYEFHCGGCQEIYVGESSRRFGKPILEHLATDKKSDVYKQAKTWYLISQGNFQKRT